MIIFNTLTGSALGLACFRTWVSDICGSAGTGRQARLRGVCASVRVQVPSAALSNTDRLTKPIRVVFCLDRFFHFVPYQLILRHCHDTCTCVLRPRRIKRGGLFPPPSFGRHVDRGPLIPQYAIYKRILPDWISRNFHEAVLSLLQKAYTLLAFSTREARHTSGPIASVAYPCF